MLEKKFFTRIKWGEKYFAGKGTMREKKQMNKTLIAKECK